MERKNNSIREGLLARLPQPANLAAYRDEVTAMLEKNERAFRREKLGVGTLWVFLVLLSTAFLWFGGEHLNSPKGPWFGALACFFLLYGAVELLKHFINRTRVNLLKEVKQVQVQVLELHALLREGSDQ